MFRITRGRGFQITFENGYTVSVQFGQFNYCANYNTMEDEKTERQFGEMGSKTAEVAIIDEKMGNSSGCAESIKVTT